MDRQEIIIDEEFQALLPELDKETYRLLEENLIENGCRDALVLWEGRLIDGYNRYKICTEHDIPYRTISKDFDSREFAEIWIISNQISRRSLTPIQLSYFRGRYYRSVKKIQGLNRQLPEESKNPKNGDFTDVTATKIAKQYNTSKNTILRDSNLSKGIDAVGEVSPEAKRKILSCEVSVNKNHLQTLAKGNEEDIKSLSDEIVEGTFTNKKNAANDDWEDNGSSDFDQAGPLPVKTAIGKITSDFQSALRKLTSDTDDERLKIALRLYIDTLEAIYSRI